MITDSQKVMSCLYFDTHLFRQLGPISYNKVVAA